MPENQIEVLSWSWGGSQPGTYGESERHFEVSIAAFDPGTDTSISFDGVLNGPGQARALANLLAQSDAEGFVFVSDDGTSEPIDDFLVSTESDANGNWCLLIEIEQQDGSTTDVVPTEQISLNFAEIKLAFEEALDLTATGDLIL